MLQTRTIEVDIAAIPFFRMELDIPNSEDPDAYVAQFLNSILDSNCRNHVDWAFIG